MMNCKNCGCVLQPNDAFCPACGKSPAVPAPAAAPAPATYAPAYTPVMPAGIQESSGKATASLICGIFFFIIPMAVLAIVFGHIALSEIKRSAGRLMGQGRAVAGLVLGYMGIAAIPFILIIAAIAIPNLLRARIAANEASAVGSVRTLNTAQISYATEHPELGYTCDLQKFSELLGPQLTSGMKSGYRFELRGCQTLADSLSSSSQTTQSALVPPGISDNAVQYYQIIAMPVNPGSTGVRVFCSDQSGVIRFVTGGTAEDCLSNGVPLS